MKKADWEDVPTPSRPIPVISLRPADTQQQYVRVTTGDALPQHTNSESSRDFGTTHSR
jgi:hypothetical protein